MSFGFIFNINSHTERPRLILWGRNWRWWNQSWSSWKRRLDVRLYLEAVLSSPGIESRHPCVFRRSVSWSISKVRSMNWNLSLRTSGRTSRWRWWRTNACAWRWRTWEHRPQSLPAYRPRPRTRAVSDLWPQTHIHNMLPFGRNSYLIQRGCIRLIKNQRQ